MPAYDKIRFVNLCERTKVKIKCLSDAAASQFRESNGVCPSGKGSSRQPPGEIESDDASDGRV